MSPGRGCRVIGGAGRSRQARRCCPPRWLISETACRGGGIDGDLGCAEAQSTARISRRARWMHPQGAAAAAPCPAASSPQARAQPAVHRHRQQLQRRRRGDQHADRRPGPVNQRRPSKPAAAPATSHRPPPAPSGSEQARPGHEQHQHRDPQRRGQPASPVRRESHSADPSRSDTAVRCDLACLAAARRSQ